ncbi:hypothetical protein SAMN05421819_3639 [Bryocella elongata]|uniref:Alpha-galactosidase n=1 Tax=Bryocella elongata TaxID=863522 RepID=A0A1H6BA88_9BACT|nr:hypothetical protein [Bryocella elongata]SEG57464.1 hypothetical protein SAMN05421819_3639 [Bryocella elongata]
MRNGEGVQRIVELTAAMGFAVTACIAPATAASQSEVRLPQADIAIHNDLLSIRYDRRAGSMDVIWRNGQKLLGLTSAAQLEDGRAISTSMYTAHELEKLQTLSNSPGGHEYTIRSTAAGLPTILQHIWIRDGRPEIAIDAELVAQTGTVGTRHFDAVVVHGQDSVLIEGSKQVRVLHVPFDNDMWFRFNSVDVASLGPRETFTSEEVTAIYDNESRHALILGSVTHNVWKTAIEAHATDGRISDLDIYGGISSPTGVRTDTHDTVPHGIVRGVHVVSPRIFIGSFSDWRDGLEAYGAANAAIHPPLKWVAGAPTGWNSWAAYGDKIDDKRYLGSAAFLRDKLVPLGFGNHKVVYINLDAFWSKLDAVQLSDAVATIKAMHGPDGTRFEPGIYWTPFAYWSDDLDAYVEGTNMKYRYRDILLKAPDGSVLPKVDGGLAIDPSHPGAKARASYFLQQFQKLGFQYLKIDFLSHGALEGVHYDPAIQTGIEAYNMGMQQVIDETGNRMFLSLSIAPLFPSGYGHARRLSCDTKGHMSGGDQSTEYMLNSLTYGWWTSKSLYITDPDHVVLGEKADLGARSVVEGKSRLLSAIISGGMMLDSSPLADDAQARQLAEAVYSNRSWLSVAAEGKTFRPVEGDTGDKATAVFVCPSDHGAYLAVFNYDEKEQRTFAIPVGRIDSKLEASSSIRVIDVASGDELTAPRADLNVKLAPSASTLLELRWK